MIYVAFEQVIGLGLGLENLGHQALGLGDVDLEFVVDFSLGEDRVGFDLALDLGLVVSHGGFINRLEDLVFTSVQRQIADGKGGGGVEVFLAESRDLDRPRQQGGRPLGPGLDRVLAREGDGAGEARADAPSVGPRAEIGRHH